MQTLNGPPRQAYSVAQVKALLRDTASLVVDKGLEVIDRSLNPVRDVTSALRDGAVSRNAYATLHGTCRLEVSTELDWGRDLIRPYIIVADAAGTISTRWNLGAYFTFIPDRGVRENPPTYDVDAVDIISLLDTPVGEAFSADAGASYLNTAVQILTDQGLTAMLVDQTNAALTLPSARVWAIDAQITWLTIVNDLLGAIGYQGLWSDWDGRARLSRYAAPSTRASEFTYDAETFTSMMVDDLRLQEPYTRTPNRWVWVRSNSTTTDTPPSEGDGIFTYVNQSTGKTSVDARGRVISRVEFVEAADQASLQARAEQAIAADMRTSAKITVSGPPMPAHWHFDRLTVYDPRLGPPVDVVGTQWTLPLSGKDMTHEWTVL